MYHSKALVFTLLFLNGLGIHSQEKLQHKVDYESFLLDAQELAEYRKSRLITVDTFNTYSQDANTIILDTRSKQAYDEINIKGAIHLNFSDFTDAALAEVVKDKNTRILIYCNNNFQSSLKALANKRTPLALNIPTFINLFGYGYKNLYELDGYLLENDTRVQFEGKAVTL